MRQLLCPRLIGRDHERDTLVLAVEAAGRGRGGGVFVLGEAGVGKSRLAREAQQLAQAAGMRVLWGRGVDVEGGAALAFRPVIEALLAAVRHDRAILAEDDTLRPFRPLLARLIPDLRDDAARAAAAADEPSVLLGEAVLRLLRVVAAEPGCLLVLEDLHWADHETLAIVDYLFANAGGERVLVLATSRPDASSGALALARSLAAHRVGQVIELPRLQPAAVREMASACLDNAPLPPTIECVLGSSAEGLPLLVEDLLAEWVAGGALVAQPNGWEVHAAVEPVVPLSFAQIVQRRLQSLGGGCVELLQLAAVLGRQFDWQLLPAASGLDEEGVLEQLQVAVDAQLLVADRHGFHFRHALTREAVLDGLSPVQRARRAGRLLDVLESAHPRLEEDEWFEVAAALAETAGDRHTAAQLLLQAGRQSLAQGALVTAEATLERARALAPTAALQLDVDESLLQVLSEAGKTDRVLAVGNALLERLADGGAMPSRVAAVHLRIARSALTGARLLKAGEHLAMARQLDRSGELEARLEALEAHVAIDERRTIDADRLAQTALATAEQSGETDVACEALIVLGRLARGGDLDRAEAAFAHALELATAAGLTVWRSRALHELGTIDMFRDWSPRRLLDARELAERSGALATVASIDVELGALYAARFELDRSLECCQRALNAARRFRLIGVESIALLFQAELHGLRQDRVGMERLLAEVPAATGDDKLYVEFCGEAFRAEASLCEDRREQAHQHFARLAEIGRHLSLAAPSPAFGEWTLLWTLDHPDAPMDEQAPPDWAMVQPINRALVQYARAVQLGRRGQAAEAAEAAATGDRVMGCVPWYLNIARRLVAEAAIRDGWGEPAAWLRQSEQFALQHGYQAVASACRSLLRRCGVRPTRRGHVGVPAPFDALGVTERELEVLVVLREGLSNKQIAARLYLSPKTVEKHVASLMGKLEMRSRAQLAALASARLGEAAPSNWGNSRL